MGRSPDRLILAIPDVPPGINQQYGRGGRRVYLTDDAVRWKERAALFIGAQAGQQGWRHEEGQTYWIAIYFSVGEGRREIDLDAPVKIIIDTVAEKLGFPDDSPKYFVKQSSQTIEARDRFVFIIVEPYDRLEWKE